MQYRVSDWMVDLLVFVDPQCTVAEALALMRRRYIHSLVVNRTPENPEYGIITSTDISDKIIAGEQNPSDVRVSEIMTTPLITIHRDSSLKECSILMRKHKIHHLPVADDKGELVGMISAADFLVAAEAMGRDVVV